jgi:hypothetical protein
MTEEGTPAAATPTRSPASRVAATSGERLMRRL